MGKVRTRRRRFIALLGVSSAALRRHRQLVGIFLELPQDVAHHFNEHQTLRLRQKVLGHQILCHLHRVHVVRVELERDGLRPVLHLALDDIVLEAEHLQFGIALGRAVIPSLLRTLVRQTFRNGRLLGCCSWREPSSVVRGSDCGIQRWHLLRNWYRCRLRR